MVRPPSLRPRQIAPHSCMGTCAEREYRCFHHDCFHCRRTPPWSGKRESIRAAASSCTCRLLQLLLPHSPPNGNINAASRHWRRCPWAAAVPLGGGGGSTIRPAVEDPLAVPDIQFLIQPKRASRLTPIHQTLQSIPFLATHPHPQKKFSE